MIASGDFSPLTFDTRACPQVLVNIIKRCIVLDSAQRCSARDAFAILRVIPARPLLERADPEQIPFNVQGKIFSLTKAMVSRCQPSILSGILTGEVALVDQDDEGRFYLNMDAEEFDALTLMLRLEQPDVRRRVEGACQRLFLPRASPVHRTHLFVFGGYGDSMERYDRTFHRWIVCGEMADAGCHFATVCTGSQVFRIGANDLVSFNVIQEKWSQPIPIIEDCRYGHGAVIVDDSIYVIGGRQNETRVPYHVVPLNSVRKWHPSNPMVWQKRASMISCRTAHATEVIGGKIFALGGCAHNNQPTDTIEMYDPSTDKWHPLGDMQYPRCDAASAVIGDNIYLLGGTSTLHRVERFNTVRNEWHECKAMPTGRYGLEAAVFDGCIWAIGGLLKERMGVMFDCRRVEIYDPRTDTWEEGPSLNHPRAFFGAACCTTTTF